MINAPSPPLLFPFGALISIIASLAGSWLFHACQLLTYKLHKYTSSSSLPSLRLTQSHTHSGGLQIGADVMAEVAG